MPGLFDPSTSPGPQKSAAVMFKDIHDVARPNPAETFAAPNTQPQPSPVAMAAIQRGAVLVGGGSGAHAGEATDTPLRPVDSVPVPMARDAFNVDQYSESGTDMNEDPSYSRTSDVPVRRPPAVTPQEEVE